MSGKDDETIDQDCDEIFKITHSIFSFYERQIIWDISGIIFLGINHPNPFNPNTYIKYNAGDNSISVMLTIYSVKGKLIKNLVQTYQKGQQKIQWNGKNEAGTRVASGIYVYQLKAGPLFFSRRMVLSK